jgi:hypothetical protein
MSVAQQQQASQYGGYGVGVPNPQQGVQAADLTLQKCGISTSQLGNLTPLQQSCLNYYQSFTGIQSAGQQPCITARSDYSKAVTDFTNACTKAKLSNDGSQGNVGCSKAVIECNSCNDDSSTSGSVDCSAAEDAADAADDSTTTTDAITGQTSKVVQIEADKASLTAEFTRCPALATDDLKTKISEMQDQETKVQDLQDKIQTAQQALSDLDTKYQSDSSQNQNNITQAGITASQKLSDIQSQLTSNQQKLAAQIQQLQADAQKQQAAIDQVNVLEAARAEKLNEYYAQALITCHTQSLAQVDQMRTQKLSEMSSSTYSAGGLNNLLKSVGLDSRTQAQLLTQQKDDYCQQDANFINGYKVAQQKEAVDIAGLEAQKKALQVQVNSDNSQIASINGTQLKQLNAQASQQITQVQSQYQAELSNLENQQKQAQTTYINTRKLKMQELGRLQRQLTEQQDYYQQKQDYVATANKFAHGQQTDPNSVYDAMDKFGDVKSKLEQVITMCCPTPTSAPDCSNLKGTLCVFNGSDMSACQTAPSSPLLTNGGASTTLGSGGSGGGYGGQRRTPASGVTPGAQQ